MRYSIRLKLTVFLTAIITLMIAALLLFSYQFSSPYFINQKTEEIEQLYLVIVESLQQNTDTLSPSIVAREENQHIWATIWDDSYTILYSSNIVDPAIYEEYTFSSSPQVQQHINKRTGEGSLMLLGIVEANGTTLHIALGSPTSAVHHSVDLIFKVTSQVAGIIIILGAICAWFFGKHFTQPILAVEKTAQAVAQFEFTSPTEVANRKDELGTLGKSINVMAGQLSSLIAELKAANSQLEQDVEQQKKQENIRKEFLANVSHELKSPLALLSMSCENLRENLPPEEHAFYCDVVSDECLRLGKLVKNLLQIANLESPNGKMEREHFDLSALTRRVCEKNGLLLNEKKLQLDTNIADGLFIDGSPFHIEQAMNNFIENAKKYASPGGRLEIALRSLAGFVEFSVYNDGEPIEAAHLERVWESFYRADQARTHDAAMSAGLGLYIVRTIVEAHHGSYCARNLESGVLFSFCLPA